MSEPLRSIRYLVAIWVFSTDKRTSGGTSVSKDITQKEVSRDTGPYL